MTSGPYKPPRQPAAITPPEEGLQPPWLMSFADFVSCLLACFVLLFSMVSLDKDKFQKIIGSIPGRANLDLQAPQPVERGMTPESAEPARSPNYLLTLLKGSFAKDPKLANLGLTGNHDRVIVSLPVNTPDRRAWRRRRQPRRTACCSRSAARCALSRTRSWCRAGASRPATRTAGASCSC